MKENSNVSGQTDVDAMRDNSQTSSSTNDDPNIGEDDEKSEPREHTRSKMALLFVLGFFAILFLCFVYAIIGELSGTLGFIVGFYYKSMKEQ